MSPVLKEESALFLKTLREDGIDEIYVEPVLKPSIKPEARPTASASSQESVSSPLKDKLMALREETLKCVKCKELAKTRKNVVFGSGNIKADLMFIGEAPGRDEDEQGLPFVGRAGQLLTKIIESIGLSRRQVFIANTLKCRPPGNRTPAPEEVLNCGPFLKKQIDWINPKIICALGSSAAQALLQTEQPISRLRGQFQDFHGIRLMCTYHPAYLLRNPGEKRKVWEDMKKIKKELGL